ncbi:MAG: hypothetical protein AAFY88_02675, partial [Acidobacteriota bacterium]
MILAAFFGLASQSLAYVKDPRARGELHGEFPCAAEECAELGIDRWVVYRRSLSGPATLSQNDEYVYLVGVDAGGKEVDEFRIFRAGENYMKTEFPEGSTPIQIVNKEGLEILFDPRAALADGFLADALAVELSDIESHSRSFLSACTIKQIAWALATTQAGIACVVDRTLIACQLAMGSATLAYVEMEQACGSNNVPQQICTPNEQDFCLCDFPFECDENRPMGFKYCNADGLGWTGCDYGCPAEPPQGCDDMCEYMGQVDQSGHCTSNVCADGQLGRRVCGADLTWDPCTCEGDSDYNVCDEEGQINPFSGAVCGDVSCPDSEDAVQVCVTDQQGRKDWSDCLCPSSGDSACTEVGRIDPSNYCPENCDSGAGERYCTSNIDGDLEWGLCYCDSEDDIGTIPDGPPGGGGIQPQSPKSSGQAFCGSIWMP